MIEIYKNMAYSQLLKKQMEIKIPKTLWIELLRLDIEGLIDIDEFVENAYETYIYQSGLSIKYEKFFPETNEESIRFNRLYNALFDDDNLECVKFNFTIKFAHFLEEHGYANMVILTKSIGHYLFLIYFNKLFNPTKPINFNLNIYTRIGGVYFIMNQSHKPIAYGYYTPDNLFSLKKKYVNNGVLEKKF